MSMLRAQLFGKFAVQRDEHSVDGLEARKVQELFSYVLLRRGHPQRRESLSDLLWGEGGGLQSRKYLRQALWQLQTALDRGREPGERPMLLVETDWIDMNLEASFWLDIRVFEEASAAAEGVPGAQLDSDRAGQLHSAVDIYRGDLLEGWYQDWCLFERERLQNLYLGMLDKLVSHAESHQDYDAGLVYAERILRCDRAHERTHRRMMRLYYLAGDRTAALRQYDRCHTALAEELGVKPARRTQLLQEQIRLDQVDNAWPQQPDAPQAPGRLVKPNLVDCLKELGALLAYAEREVEHQIRRLESEGQ